MNRTPNIFLIVIFFLMMLFMINVLSKKYTTASVVYYLKMPKPVTLYDKEKITFWYSVKLKDAKGNIKSISNFSRLANDIGIFYDINDTIPESFLFKK